MRQEIRKIALLTGGGDCPGLNAVLRAITKSAILKHGYEVIGYKYGYRGLYNNEYIPMNTNTVSGILHKGGTILYTSNRDNLFDYAVEENGVTVRRDVSDKAIENMKKEGVDVLVVLGGDGTLTSARDFARKGFNVIGVPKTIDNDIIGTDISFGFQSAVNVVVDALDKLHTTAESHERIMILEVMGRNAGWIALNSGIAGSADIILIPEIPYDIEKIMYKIKRRRDKGKPFSNIVIAEGAKPIGGDVVVKKRVEGSPEPLRLGGVGYALAAELEKHITDSEIRCTVLGHLQRGGIVSAYDRLLCTRLGVAAVDMIHQRKFGEMVSIVGNSISSVSLETVGGDSRVVPLDDELVKVAREIGISFGD